MTVANIILQQLGGGRFLAMTGAKNLTGSEDALSFALPRGLAKYEKKAITHVRIVLTQNDTYHVEFLNITMRPALKRTVVVEHDDVYADDLQSIFTESTGLDTRL